MISHKQTTPLLQSLTRPILLLGGERENIILLACIALGLWTAGRDFISVMLAVFIWTIGVIASKLTAKTDPWATKIFIRSLAYQDFYGARERINTPQSIVKRSRKI